MHVFGTNATELVHIGQAVMGCGGTVDYLVDAVLQLPDVVGGLQGRRAGRDEQDAHTQLVLRPEPMATSVAHPNR